MSDFADRATRAAAELRAAAAATDPAEVEALIEAIANAGRVVCHGVGREGLMMRALAMRLYHMGCDAHVVGDMSTPPVGVGDLLIVSAGPGELFTVNALLAVANAAGASTACITAQPEGTAPRSASLVLTLPAQTMATDRDAAASSILPMGSTFEGAQFLVFELMVLALRDRLGVTPEAMRARHTNLE